VVAELLRRASDTLLWTAVPESRPDERLWGFIAVDRRSLDESFLSNDRLRVMSYTGLNWTVFHRFGDRNVSLIVENGSTSRLGPIRAACMSCKWSVGVALFGVGSILMAFAADMFLIDIESAWRAGWIARLCTWALSSTLPVLVALIVSSYRRSREQTSLLKRLTWAGFCATALGVLELVLAMALFELMGIF